MREGREEERNNLCSLGQLKKGIKLIYNSKGKGRKVILTCEKQKMADKKMPSNRSVV